MKTFRYLLAGASFLIASAAHADVVLKMNSWMPAPHPLVADLHAPFAEEVAKVTEGRVRIEILPAPLGPPPAAFDLARDGVVDVAYGVQGYSPGRFKTAILGEMPFLSDDAVVTSVAFWRVHEAMLAQAGEYEGVKVLGVFTHGPGAIYSREPINVVDDIAGQKIRTGGIFAEDIAASLGAVPVQAPAPKVYEVLSQGVADGIFFPAETVPFFKLQEILKSAYTVDGGIYNTAFFTVMNEAKWKQIPEADRALIEPLLGEAFARRAGEMWNAADAQGRAEMKGKIAFKAATSEETAELHERLKPLVDQRIAEVTAAGIDGQVAYDMLLGEIANIEAGE